jgi:DNA topoisomerase-2
MNDGDGISSAVHAATQIYTPLNLFGQLLTLLPTMMTLRADHWRNERIAKACIFSKEFRIETVDHELKKLYKQTWTENMSICHPPKITACKNLPYTRVTFTDYARFGMETLT